MTKHFAMVKNQCQCRKANPLVLGHCIFKTGTKLQTATARDFYLEGEVSEKNLNFLSRFPFSQMEPIFEVWQVYDKTNSLLQRTPREL